MNQLLTKKIKKQNLYREYLEVLNGKLNLPFRTSQVLAYLMRIDAGWDSEVYGPKNIIDTRTRKILQKELMIERANLANQIKNLKNLGILIEDDGKWRIDSRYMPVLTDNKFSITFMFETE